MFSSKFKLISIYFLVGCVHCDGGCRKQKNESIRTYLKHKRLCKLTSQILRTLIAPNCVRSIKINTDSPLRALVSLQFVAIFFGLQSKPRNYVIITLRSGFLQRRSWDEMISIPGDPKLFPVPVFSPPFSVVKERIAVSFRMIAATSE